MSAMTVRASAQRQPNRAVFRPQNGGWTRT
jgi:hypothetical protein